MYNSTKDKATLRLLVDECLPLYQCPESSSPSFSQSSQNKDHKLAISIDEMEKSMDISAVCISTLLCYLEQQGYLEIKYIINDRCTLECSDGPSQLKALAKKVPSVAAAIKALKEDGMCSYSIVCIFKV